MLGTGRVMMQTCLVPKVGSPPLVEGGEPVSVPPATTLRLLLSGGNPRSLGAVDLVIGLCRTEPKRVDELVSCVVDCPDEIVRMRASDALEKLCRAQPPLVQPHLSTILCAMSRIDQPSVQWHVAQMLAELVLDAAQREGAVRILSDYIQSSGDWIVLNCTLDTLAVFARQEPALVEQLRGELHRFEDHRLKSVSSRARRLLAEFGP